MSDIGPAPESGASFTFDEIACHVWAIDGYADGGRAAKVNAAYVTAANAVKFPPLAKSNRNDILANIIKSVRSAVGTELTAEACIIYGGFDGLNKAPEHMWVEYKGALYETMPGKKLYTEVATDDSRIKPQLEGNVFGKANVAAVKSVLSKTQKAMIDGFPKAK